MKTEYIYLHESSITEEEYLKFLKKYYGDKAEYRFYKRYKWYNQYLGFHCLLAIVDGDIVGQSCAFRVRMMTPSGEVEWWWGCDSFVLKDYRGKGIGQKLQSKLDSDHLHFGSVIYSPTNGHIKKKIGANVVTHTYPTYYPVARFFSVCSQLLYMRITGKRSVKKSKIPGIPIYKLFNKSNLNNWEIKENSFTDTNIQFINNTLSKRYDFYIIRDSAYLRWKYVENPSVAYHLLEVRKNNDLHAVIIFSVPFNGMFVLCPLKLTKILDFFISEESTLTTKDILNIISDYYAKKGDSIDGILGLFKSAYFPHFTYPIKGQELLAKYSNNNVIRPYISYSDHDLEQIPDLEI